MGAIILTGTRKPLHHKPFLRQYNETYGVWEELRFVIVALPGLFSYHYISYVFNVGVGCSASNLMLNKYFIV